MATKQNEGLSDAEKEMLGTYRASLSPAPARKAKAWAALGSVAKAGAGAGTAAAGATKLIVLSALTTATVLGGVGAWVAAEDTSTETSAASSTQTTHEDPAPPTTAPAGPPRGEAQAQPMTPLRPDVVRLDPSVPPVEPVRNSPISRSPAANAGQPQTSDVVLPRTLEAEARSLEKMRSALSAGRNARVLSLVSAHRQEFEHAVFAEEVDGLEVMASCRRSPDASARKRLAAFASRYPASPQTPALRRACRPAQVPVQRPSKTGP